MNVQQLITIPSTNPAGDANILLNLFPEQTLEKTENVYFIVQDGQRRWTFFFVPQQRTSDNGSPTKDKNHDSMVKGGLMTLVLEPEEISNVTKKCLQNELKGWDLLVEDQVLRIVLPGGTWLLLVSSSLVSSSEGRIQLAKLLQEQQQQMQNKHSRIYPEPNGTPRTMKTLDESSHNNDDESISNAVVVEKLPQFPSLQVQVPQPNSNGGMVSSDFLLNSRVPVPIESDLFAGKMLIILRPANPEVDDPYWNERIFSKRKRRMIIQIQGKFKRKPKGVVYAGGEVSDPMKLGLLSRGLCTILLNLVDRLNANMHYSFGDDERTEEAHIVVPAYTFFERLVVTPPLETPPTLGDDFVESEESLQQRRKSKSTGDWNTDDTYSMSFYSMYVDLPRWKIVNVPVTKDIDLKTFWGNSFLRIVLYEMNTPSGGGDSRHLKQYNNYALTIKVEFKGHGRTTAIRGTAERDDDRSSQGGDDEILPWNTSKPLVKRQPSRIFLRSSASSVSFIDSNNNDDDDDDTDEFFFFDAEEDLLEEETDITTISRSTTSPLDLLSRIDQLCPAWIEVWSPHHKGSYMAVYAFNVQNSSRTVLRSYQLCTDCFDREDSRRLVEERFSHRLAWHERNRRIFGHAFAKALDEKISSNSNKLNRFEGASSEYDVLFLKRKDPVFSLSDHKSHSRIVKSAFVARAISDRHWIEEWTKIADGFMSFYPPERSKARYRLSLTSMVNVERVDPAYCPYFPNHHFMAIETVGRRIYLMFASELERDDWVAFLAEKLRASQEIASAQCKKVNVNDQLMKVDDPSEEFLHKSTMWDCKQRRILNCRHFCFRQLQNIDPLALGEDALRKALAHEDKNVTALGNFLDAAAMLKFVDANKLNDNERLAFFLNVYHTLLMHAFLVLGPPDNGFKWISYFNTISYQCSDDIFSLAELEHCIIRAEMSYPSQFISRFVVPKSKYIFGLAKPDYRINFALNCGTVSNPDAVPIFKANGLDQQLEATSRFFLDQQVTIKQKSAHEIVIHLPRVCQWFSEDFGCGSSDDILRRIEPYLSEDKRRLLATCWIEREKRYNFWELGVKFLPYSFECRFLALAEIS